MRRAAVGVARDRQGTNVVLLKPDVAKVCRDSATVNEALRRYLSEHGTRPRRYAKRRADRPPSWTFSRAIGSRPKVSQGSEERVDLVVSFKPSDASGRHVREAPLDGVLKP
jgi:hypothetical protein